MEEELKQNTQQPKDGQSASPKHMSIRSILGGDILANDFFKRQTRLLILIMILTVLYSTTVIAANRNSLKLTS